MAAPAVQTRAALPNGTRITSGHVTKVAIGDFLDLAIWEREVTPPPFQMDEALDITTQFNNVVRTYNPRRLYMMEDLTVTGHYDPKIYGNIITDRLIGFCTEITLQWPDLSTLTFWGFVSRIEGSALTEEEVPEVTVTITPTNTDPTTCEEEEPVFSDGTQNACCPVNT